MVGLESHAWCLRQKVATATPTAHRPQQREGAAASCGNNTLCWAESGSRIKGVLLRQALLPEPHLAVPQQLSSSPALQRPGINSVQERLQFGCGVFRPKNRLMKTKTRNKSVP
ncbi:Hypothetical predicted protein [Marmota monax]|uniref:Uncharacterized protein n=1 Tax=Marmota monax TaxID=9995 RepID=A0A5E4C9J0_MARMO|nr:Hypothetical predicted protein [Marmota monax]